MRKLAILASIAILAGCASTPALPPAPKIQKVDVPVEVTCKSPAVTPPLFAVDSLPIGSGIYDQMAALRAERLQRIGYEKELIAALKSCQ